MDLNPKLVNVIVIAYGIALGGSYFWGFSKLAYARKIRDRIKKIAETNTLVITDFAGNNVSLEKFCDRLFAPEHVFEENQETRSYKTKIRITSALFLLLVILAFLAVYYLT